MRTFPLWSQCLHSEQGPRSSCNPQHLLYLMESGNQPGELQSISLPASKLCLEDKQDQPALPFCCAPMAGLRRPGYMGSQCALLLLGQG